MDDFEGLELENFDNPPVDLNLSDLLKDLVRDLLKCFPFVDICNSCCFLLYESIMENYMEGNYTL